MLTFVLYCFWCSKYFGFLLFNFIKLPQDLWMKNIYIYIFFSCWNTTVAIATGEHFNLLRELQLANRLPDTFWCIALVVIVVKMSKNASNGINFLQKSLNWTIWQVQRRQFSHTHTHKHIWMHLEKFYLAHSICNASWVNWVNWYFL